MQTVTLRIGPLDEPQDAYPLRLNDGAPGWLPKARLAEAPWTQAAIRDRVLDDRPPKADEFRQIGKVLFDWLFPEPLLSEWRALWAPTPLVPAPAPLLALDIEPADLTSLPWELMYNVKGGAAATYPGLVGGVVRLDRRPLKTAMCSEWPLRILLVVGCSEAEEAALAIGGETESIWRTFLSLGRSVDIYRIPRPSREELMAYVGTYHPHVLHFCGHAQDLPVLGKAGLVIDGKVPWVWSAADIPADLQLKNWVPKFVFLNACRSAVEHETVGSIQDAFLKEGVAAVAAMQANVLGDRAGCFAVNLYRRLAEGEDIVTAATAARSDLVNKILQTYDLKDWALPALTVKEAAITPAYPALQCKPSWPTTPEFEQCGEFEEARFFAGQAELRRLFTNWYYPIKRPPEPPPVLVVSGAARCGKSHLAKWCLENCMLSNVHIRYVEVHNGQRRDFLSVLRQIRSGDASKSAPAGQLLHSGLPERAFRRFNWDLNNLLGPAGDNRQWNPAEQPDIIPDADYQLTDGRRETVLIDIFKSFLDALREAAKEKPILLALDQFVGPEDQLLIPKADVDLLTRNLFKPIADGAVPDVKLLMVLDAPDPLGVMDRMPKTKVWPIDVSHTFPNNTLVDLALEMFRYPGGEDEKDLKDLAEKILPKMREPRPRGLAKLRTIRDLVVEYGVLSGLSVERMR